LTICVRKPSKEMFRAINRKNWKGLYPHCKNCESSIMKNKYKKNPIPQMLSNVKIRAKLKSTNFNLTTE
jgi:hypothetical protein